MKYIFNKSAKKMTKYECSRCFQSFASKQKLTQHQSKKRKCIEVKKNDYLEVKPEYGEFKVTFKDVDPEILMVKLWELLGKDRVITYKKIQTVVKTVEPIVEPTVEAVEPIVEAVEPIVETEIEKELQLENDKEIIINDLEKQYKDELKIINKKYKNDDVRLKKATELFKKKSSKIDKINKSKTIAKVKPVLIKEEKNEKVIDINKYVEIAKETHNKIQDTRTKIYKIIDIKGKETAESNKLKDSIDKLQTRLVNVKKALRNSGYDTKQIKFRKEVVEEEEEVVEDEEEDENYGDIPRR